jgi:membrane protease YdiL (CAAX protease family)
MNLRTGHLSNVLSLLLILLGLIVVIVVGSVIATGLSALSLVVSGSELPGLRELANQAMETDHWMIVAELIRGIGSLGLVALMVVRFDGRSFRFTAVGIARRPNPGLMILTGVLVTSVLFLGAGSVAAVRGVEMGEPGLSDAFAQIGASGLAVLTISTLANAFWQELAFRGYLQPRLQRSYGILPGILICSFVFVILHGLARPLSMPEVITGTILFSLVGWLYFVSNSIVLATALHATGNFYLNVSSEVGVALPPYVDRSLAYSVGLLVALVLFRRRVSLTTRAETQ